MTDAEIAEARTWVHDIIRDAGGIKALPISTVIACGLILDLTHEIQIARLPKLSEAERHAAGGYYCQNCSRVLCEKQGDVCATCRGYLARSLQRGPR